MDGDATDAPKPVLSAVFFLNPIVVVAPQVVALSHVAAATRAPGCSSLDRSW